MNNMHVNDLSDNSCY